MGRASRSSAAALEPLSPQRKWRAITLATLLLVPGFWSMLAGLVAIAADDADGAPNAPAALALGFALIPFVFIVLAFMSWHPRAPMAVVKAMAMSLLVGVVVSAMAADAVTGLVAGVGAGGILALRADALHSWKTRAAAVAFATAYTFVLVRTVGSAVLLPAPIFPFTAIGLADHYAEWRADRAASTEPAT
jgi:hypothetical protein